MGSCSSERRKTSRSKIGRRREKGKKIGYPIGLVALAAGPGGENFWGSEASESDVTSRYIPLWIGGTVQTPRFFP